MEWKVPLSDLDYGPEELVAARHVLESRWLTMGSVTARFEQSLAEYLGVQHVLAVSNATAALHLAAVALGIGEGDEVILPSLTFVATANAIRYSGAATIFADITNDQDLGISPASVSAAITPRTKAIVVMHYGGYMCDMSAILALAKEHNLAVIEDAAHAPGAKLEAQMAGTWGDVGCFSFFSNKNLATGEGGAIVTNHDDLAEHLRLMRSHGMTSLSWDRHRGHAYAYDVVELGYNYRIDEIRSALGLVQLEKLVNNNERRRALNEGYRSALDGMQGLSLPYLSHRGVSSAHLMPILLSPSINRSRFVESMHANGIQTSVHYPPVHQFTYYREYGEASNLPVTTDVAAREVTLPLYPTMDERNLQLVVSSVAEALDAASI